MERIKIKNICEVNPKQEILDDNFIISFIGMAQISNDNQFDTSILKKYEDVKKGFSSFKDGDILFAKITPCMENGKGVLIENLYNGIGFGSTEFHVLRPNIKVVDKKYLYWFTMYKKFRLNCEKNMTGSAGQKRVPKNYIENYEIKLPELIIQEKRAKILDNILKIKQEKLEQLKRLEELNKSIFIEMFGDPIKNGKKWKLEKMLVVAPIQQSIKISKEMVWLLNLDGIESETGKIIKYEKKLFKEIEKNSIISFNEENVLYSKLRPYLNKVVIPEEEGYGTSELLPLKPDKNKIKRIFLANLLRTKSFVNYVNNKTIGAKMPRVSTKEIMNFNCIIPPIELQNSFAERIKMIEKSKVEIQKSIEETQKLFDSLMEKYFG